LNNKLISMVGSVTLTFFLISSAGCSADSDLSKLSVASGAIDNVAEELDNLEPSPYENKCLPLMEKHELIMESIEGVRIIEPQREELVDIFSQCYDAIKHEIKITTVEFIKLPIDSRCLTKAHELSQSLNDLQLTIEEFSTMPLAKKEENNAVKAGAGMIPLGIALAGGHVMMNRMTVCTMEKSGFNSDLFNQE